MRVSVRLVAVMAALMVALSVAAQNTLKVVGTVRDETGEPVAGATVGIKGESSARGLTNVEGRFELEGIATNAVLVFSYMGLETTEVRARATVNVTMRESASTMQELIVTSFGMQTRESFTGSAGVVRSEDLLRKQTSNVIAAIQGEIAGVQMTNTSGDPTAEPTIRIRGFSSINAANDPLIILDGSPYDGGFNSINPADVESVTVLKDAASNALYGARGANGVILITTKSAARGENRTTITLDAK